MNVLVSILLGIVAAVIAANIAGLWAVTAPLAWLIGVIAFVVVALWFHSYAKRRNLFV